MAGLLRYTSKRSPLKPHSLSNRSAIWFGNAGSFCCYGSLLVPFVWLLNIVLPFWWPDFGGAFLTSDLLLPSVVTFFVSSSIGLLCLIAGFFSEL